MSIRNRLDLNVHVCAYVYLFFFSLLVCQICSIEPTCDPARRDNSLSILINLRLHPWNTHTEGRTHTNTQTDTQSRNALIVRTVTLKCTHTPISTLSVTPHFTTQRPHSPHHSVGCTCIQMYGDKHTHTHTKQMLTPPVLVFWVFSTVGVCMTHTPGGLWEQRGLYY